MPLKVPARFKTVPVLLAYVNIFSNKRVYSIEIFFENIYGINAVTPELKLIVGFISCKNTSVCFEFNNPKV